VTAAQNDPVAFLRVIASLIPKEPDATITPVSERMSDAQLDATMRKGRLDPEAPSVDRRASRRTFQ